MIKVIIYLYTINIVASVKFILGMLCFSACIEGAPHRLNIFNKYKKRKFYAILLKAF